MNMRTMTSVEAQSHFGEMLDTALREPVTITRHGRPVAVVVSPEDLQELSATRAIEALKRYRRAAKKEGREPISEEDLQRLIADVR
jgi:antitoxin Phd